MARATLERWLMCLVVVLVGWLLWSPVAFAATIRAASCALADVQAAVNAAAVGDTVRLPTCIQTTWTTTVTIAKRIKLQGNGTGNTILRRSRVSATWPDPSTPGSGNPMFFINGVTGFEMTGITLDGTRDTDPNVYKDRGLFLNNCVDFRIYHMAFNDFAIAIHVQGDATVQRGLIDHNTFTDNFHVTPSTSLGYGVMVFGNGTYPALALGTSQNVFIEDNTFTRSKHSVASNNGSRYVFRHNTDNDSGTDFFAAWDAHGLKDWPSGSRQYEIYNNTLTHTDTHLAGVVIRGGDGVIFNNSFRGKYINFELWMFHEKGCSGSWPQPQQIRKLYFWNNTRLGGAVARIFNACTSLLQLNRDYFTTARPNYTPYTYPHPRQGIPVAPPAPTNLRVETD